MLLKFKVKIKNGVITTNGAEHASTTTEVSTSTAIICVSAADERATQRSRTLALVTGRCTVFLRMSSRVPHTATLKTTVAKISRRLAEPYRKEYAAGSGSCFRHSMKHQVSDVCSSTWRR